MNKVTLAIVAALSAAIALGDDFKTIDGKEYKNATLSRVEPDGIVISSKSVIAKLYFTELPKEVQERFHYDAAKGDAYSAEQNAALEQARNPQEEAMRQKAEATERKNNAAGGELAARESANNQQNNVQALQASYSELQKQEDDLVRRIQEAEQLPKYLTGQSGRKYYSYLNPAWRYVPDWQKSLNDVRHKKDDVRKQIEQAQR